MSSALHSTQSNSDHGGYGSGSASEKSPLGNIPFLNKLGGEKKQTKDGQPPKRRGPKPDSKPAMTRRQELNRQAQRTHRERKEQYIKALEQEVLRLKELYSDSTRERDEVRRENQRLKALLAQHGISYDFAESPVKFQRENSGNTSYHPSSSGSISGSYRTGSESASTFSPPGSNNMNSAPPVPTLPNNVSNQPVQRSAAQLPNSQIDYDDIGIDFVLTYDSQGNPMQVPAPHPYPSPPLQQGLLERPCMEHMQYLVVRSHNSDEQAFRHPLENADDRDQDNMSGHALMATCPPFSHVMGKPNEPFPHQMPDIAMPDLTKLLDLSARLPLDHEGEITPIMAWTQVYTHPRVGDFSKPDLERIKAGLAGKCRCYGFGAVLEEFEVSDAIATVLAEKDGTTLPAPDMANQPQALYAQ